MEARQAVSSGREGGKISLKGKSDNGMGVKGVQ